MRIVAPTRVSRTHTQSLNGSADDVFSLLCPVREAEWIEGWDPDLVITTSGVAERDCVFTTGEGADAAVWVVTRYESEENIIEFVKVTPGFTVARIFIEVVPAGEHECRAIVTYQHTSLGPAGDEFVKGFSAYAYERFMQAWEARLNHFLATGRMLPDAELPRA